MRKKDDDHQVTNADRSSSRDRPSEVDAWALRVHTFQMVARAKAVRARGQASEQARVLRVLAERIETDEAPLPARVFLPLRDLVAANEELAPSDWEAVWVEELERRLKAVRAGKVKRIPASQVVEEALALAKRTLR
jgi:hypothetical protein